MMARSVYSSCTLRSRPAMQHAARIWGTRPCCTRLHIHTPPTVVQASNTPDQSSLCRPDASDPASTVPRISRRLCFGTLLAWLPAQHASAIIRSSAWAHPVVLTIYNDSTSIVKVYWFNYDGDQEYYTSIRPGSSWTVDTFETHGWCLKDADTGATLQQYVVGTGDEQQLRIAATSAAALQSPGGSSSTALAAGSSGAQQAPSGSSAGSSPGDSTAEAAPPAGQEALASEAQPFSGFDGLGSGEASFSKAKLQEVRLGAAGGVMLLAVQGYSRPVQLAIGLLEAVVVVYAAGVESRRPSTANTWARTLQVSGAVVERAVLTRQMGPVFYARIVLRLPSGSLCSLDSRPSDALALALQLQAPLYVANSVAQEAQRLPLPQLGPGPGPDVVPGLPAVPYELLNPQLLPQA